MFLREQSCQFEVLGQRMRALFNPMGRWPFVVLAVVLCSSAGCNSLSNRTLVKQLQGENERLISEFRAQKEQANQLAQRNQLLEGRLAESEKLIARELGASRISSLPNTSLPPQRPIAPLGSSGAGPSPLKPLDTSLRWESR